MTIKYSLRGPIFDTQGTEIQTDHPVTLAEAQRIARLADQRLVLLDEQGFGRGWVDSDGSYKLS